MSDVADDRLHAPAAQRNRGPILDVLRETLPARGLVLEIASGTGEHVAHFAQSLPALTFQPSDPDARARASVAAWIAATGLANIRAPLELDVTRAPWPLARADALLCINMIHISPWEATESLFAAAAALLPDGAPLVTYGPYKREGVHTAPSNAEFDASLRATNPAWGVRDLETVAACAARNGFSAPRIVEMPANNLTLVFRSRA
jgi:SAM-dependent methyltransferase